MHAAPFSEIGRGASRFHARANGGPIALVEDSRCFGIGHGRFCRETQYGAEFRRETRSALLEIGLVDPDTSDLNGQTQQLVAFSWCPNLASVYPGCILHTLSA